MTFTWQSGNVLWDMNVFPPKCEIHTFDWIATQSGPRVTQY